jgi:hypothetical protein
MFACFYERSSCAPKRRELWGPGILQEQARELDHGAGKLMPSRQTLATVEAKVKEAKLQNESWRYATCERAGLEGALS